MTSTFSTCDHIREQFAKAGPSFKVDQAPAEDDTRKKDGHTLSMNDITREELRSTLSDIENRMDRRFERLEQAEERRSEAWRREQEAYRHEQKMRDQLYSERFEATNRRLEDRDKVIDSKLDAVTASVKLMSDKVDGFSGELTSKVDEVRASNRNTVLAILGIVVSVGIATVIGLWGANSTIVGSASSIFAAGQQQNANEDTLRKLLEEAKKQSAETRELLDRVKAGQQTQTTRSKASK
ncbi:hypothetical protein [Pseudomonas parafulva]|uniref:hypothetical protein n=1 Tax=Pseudomonas parafulva TaxID=157782 RepID=UPI001E58C969|nr:hypothetical protein [Pseudomonas parafulva]